MLPTATEVAGVIASDYRGTNISTGRLIDELADRYQLSEEMKQSKEISRETGKPNGNKVWSHCVHRALNILAKKGQARRMRQGQWNIQSVYNENTKPEVNAMPITVPPDPSQLKRRVGASIQEVYGTLEFHRTKVKECEEILTELGLPIPGSSSD